MKSMLLFNQKIAIQDDNTYGIDNLILIVQSIGRARRLYKELKAEYQSKPEPKHWLGKAWQAILDFFKFKNEFKDLGKILMQLETNRAIILAEIKDLGGKELSLLATEAAREFNFTGAKMLDFLQNNLPALFDGLKMFLED